MKKLTTKAAICIASIVSMSVGVMASNGVEEIKAYLRPDITIKYDGITTALSDASGNRIYPLSYEGTTYVPLRAVSDLVGLNVDWDGEENAVLLGKTGVAKNFFTELTPYSSSNFGLTTNDHGTIAGKQYNHWIGNRWTGSAHYDLGARFKTLKFQLYSEYDKVIKFYGDNDRLLKTIEVKAKALPEYHNVDLSNVTQLKIERGDDLYMMNATIE